MRMWDWYVLDENVLQGHATYAVLLLYIGSP